MSRFISNVAQRVSALDAARRYGLRIEHNKAHCIHGHSDSIPSMSFRPRDGFCMCFCCNRPVSAIDIAAHQLNMSALDAARQIDADYGLGLWTDPGTRPAQPAAKPAQRPLQQWELKERAKSIRREANAELKAVEAEFDPDSGEEPSKELLDKLHKAVADRSAAEEYINNIDAEEWPHE